MILKAHGLTVVYSDGTKAIDGLDFELADGESAALIGANGAGKTTLLHTLVGILEPSGGEIHVGDMILGKKTISDARRMIGLVFQNPDDQLFMPRIYDDVAFGPRNMGLSELEVKECVDEALGALGAEYLSQRSPLKLSGGEKRVAAIATVLAMRPSVMLFDEPTAFLDPRARRGLYELMKKLPHSKLIATHDLDFAVEVCSRAILLRDGKVFADGAPGTVFMDTKLMRECGL